MLSASPSSCTGFSETVAESQELEGMQLGVLLYTASEWLEKGPHLLCPEKTVYSCFFQKVFPLPGWLQYSEEGCEGRMGGGWGSGGLLASTHVSFSSPCQVNKTTHLLVTPRVRREVRRHFKCPSLEGGELEDQGDLGTAMTHWEKRLFGDEAMTGNHQQLELEGKIWREEQPISRISLAVLQDSGW